MDNNTFFHGFSNNKHTLLGLHELKEFTQWNLTLSYDKCIIYRIECMGYNSE